MSENRTFGVLDRTRKHTPCVGDTHARWYQDLKYFDAEGNEISAEAAALPEEPGAIMAAQERVNASRAVGARLSSAAPLLPEKTAPSLHELENLLFDRYVDQGFSDEDAREMARAASSAAPAAAATGEVSETQEPPIPDEPTLTPEEALEIATTNDEKRAALSRMHHTHVLKMVQSLGLEPASGKGAQDANIELLLQHDAREAAQPA